MRFRFVKAVPAHVIALGFFLACLICARPALATPTTADSDSALPVTSSSAGTAGSSFSVLPTSNQWVFDRAKTFIFLSLTRSNLFAPSLVLSHFQVDFNSETYTVPKLIADLKIRDFGRITLAGRYELGFVHRDASLTSLTTSASLSAENADLMAIPIGAGPILKFPIGEMFVPFAGYVGEETLYRVSSSLSGAEAQGTLFTHGPLLGLEVMTNDPDWKLALSIAYQKVFAPSSSQLARSGDDLTAGLGWYF